MSTVNDFPETSRYTELQCGLISTRQCDDAGIGRGRRSRLVSTGRWVHVVRGVYDTEPVRSRGFDEDRQRAAWIGLLAMGPTAIAVGTNALALHGLAGLPKRLPPEVALRGGRGLTGPEGVLVRRYTDFGTQRIGSHVISDVPSALVHALPALSRNHAIAVLDSALNQQKITTKDLVTIQQRLHGRRGVARLAPWWPLVDGRAQSPLETWARLECLDHGLPPDDLQVAMHSGAGSLLGYGDLGWRRDDGGWVIVEMDGQDVHSTPHALFHDRSRQNQFLTETKIVLLRFTMAEVRRSGTIARHVRTALNR